MKHLYAPIFLCLFLNGLTLQGQTMCTPSSNGYYMVDFEGLARGEIIDANTYAAQGIHFESLAGNNHPLVAFDTRNPTTGAINGGDGDPDLGSPNEACSSCTGAQAANGQCGVGAAGAPTGIAPNCVPQGMILVIEENFTDTNNDGNDDVPDDLGGGGSFRIYFDQPTTIGKIGFLDDIDVIVTIKYADGSPDGSFSYTGPGENAYGEWDINTGGAGNQAHNITELIFDLNGSGGIASIETCKAFASVGDFVWHDENGNGIQDAGEDGIGQATVRLLDEDMNFLASTMTDNDGSYIFEDLDPGDYFIEFVLPSGYDGISPKGAGNEPQIDSDADPNTLKSDQFSLQVLDFNSDIDAGFFQASSLGNFVWEDVNGNGIQDPGENGVNGVRVTLYDSDDSQISQQNTMNGGLYNFTDLAPGDYYLVFDNLPANYVFTQKGQGNAATGSDADPNTGQATTTTLVSGENDPNWDAGIYVPASLGDFVWHDINGDGNQDAEPGVNGVTVTLFDVDDNQIAQQSTMNGGQYNFTDLAPGDYYLVFTDLPTDYVFTQQGGGGATNDSDPDPTNGQTGTFSLTSGENDLSWDAGVFQFASLGDFVWEDLNGNGIQDIGENGIDGVRVTLYDRDDTQIAQQNTINGGQYSFTDLDPGNYYVVFDNLPTDYVFTQAGMGSSTNGSDADPSSGQTNLIMLISGENDPSWDSGIWQPGSIGNFVWDDADAEGDFDIGELGIENVMVVLMEGTQPIDTQYTNSSGGYLFTDLPAGNYMVVIDPTNFNDGEPLFDMQNTFDRDANTDNQSPVSLAYGEDDELEDFGYAPSIFLPIELVSFDAQSLGNHVMIDWTTAFEENVEQFEILRSNDLINFEQIGSVTAANLGHGLQDYQFEDLKSQPGINYYQLRILEADGTITYSEVRAVNVQNLSALATWPNPAVSHLDIQVGKIDTEIILLNDQGRKVKRFSTSDQVHRLSIEDLPAGMYYLHIINDNEMSTSRFVKL